MTATVIFGWLSGLGYSRAKPHIWRAQFRKFDSWIAPLQILLARRFARPNARFPWVSLLMDNLLTLIEFFW